MRSMGVFMQTSVIRSRINFNTTPYLPRLVTGSKNTLVHKDDEQQGPGAIGKRIQALMDAYGWKDGDVVSRVGEDVLKQPTLFRLRNGQSKDPRDKTLRPIARALGVTLEELRGYKPMTIPPRPPGVGPEKRPSRSQVARLRLILVQRIAAATDDSVIECARFMREPFPEDEDGDP